MCSFSFCRFSSRSIQDPMFLYILPCIRSIGLASPLISFYWYELSQPSLILQTYLCMYFILATELSCLALRCGWPLAINRDNHADCCFTDRIYIYIYIYEGASRCWWNWSTSDFLIPRTRGGCVESRDVDNEFHMFFPEFLIIVFATRPDSGVPWVFLLPVYVISRRRSGG